MAAPSAEEKQSTGVQVIRLPAEACDRLRENLDAAIELIDGDEFARAMGYADVAGTEDDGVGAEIDQARRLGAERDRSGFLPG